MLENRCCWVDYQLIYPMGPRFHHFNVNQGIVHQNTIKVEMMARLEVSVICLFSVHRSGNAEYLQYLLRAWCWIEINQRKKYFIGSSFVAIMWLLLKEKNTRCSYSRAVSEAALCSKVRRVAALWDVELPGFHGGLSTAINMCWLKVIYDPRHQEPIL